MRFPAAAVGTVVSLVAAPGALVVTLVTALAVAVAVASSDPGEGRRTCPVGGARARRQAKWVLALTVIAVVAIGPGPPASAAPSDGRTYQPPVTAPVVDPFRPPAQPWLAGNRGLEYATVAGTPVGAIGPGVVTFAGPVAGALHVTVTHPDGLRSSYSFLAAVRVRVGDRVATGEVVGIAADRFHVGVRRGERYLDPASLWGRRVGGGRVVLVPLDGGGADGLPSPPSAGPTPRSPTGQPRSPWGLGRGIGRAGDALVGALGSPVSLRSGAP